MSSGLLRVPLEIIYMIVEDGGLTTRDVKNLRSVHSGLNRLLSPRLFRRVGFSFVGHVAGGPTAKLHRTKRLENVDSLRGSNMATLPRTFSMVVHQKASEFPAFALAFPEGCAKLGGVFPNIQKVELDVDLSQVSVGQGRMLMEGIGGYAKGKTLAVCLTGMTYRRLDTLAFVPGDAEELTLKCTATDEVAKQTVTLLKRSTNLRRLELDGFGSRAISMFGGWEDPTDSDGSSGVPDEVWGRIGSLKLMNESKWGVADINRGMLGPNNLDKFTSLRDLEVDESESEGFRDGRTLWDDLLICPTVKLVTLIPHASACDSLFTYLSSQSRMSRLEKIELKIEIHSRTLDRGHIWVEPGTTARWGSILFKSFLPNVSKNIKHLSLELHKARGVHHENHRERYIPRIRPLSFIDRAGQDYTFLRLETLRAMILWAPGAFRSFMRAIRRSPKLKRIDLDVHVIWTRMMKLHEPALTEVEAYPAPDAESAQAWSANGVVLHVSVTVVGFWQEVVREYKFKGKRWERDFNIQTT